VDDDEGDDHHPDVPAEDLPQQPPTVGAGDHQAAMVDEPEQQPHQDPVDQQPVEHDRSSFAAKGQLRRAGWGLGWGYLAPGCMVSWVLLATAAAIGILLP
jgi:hypothetical protein